MKPFNAVQLSFVRTSLPVRQMLLVSAYASAVCAATWCSAAVAAPPPGAQGVERPADEPAAKSSAGAKGS